MPRGPLHARRQAGAALSRRAGRARRARVPDDRRLPRPRRWSGAARDRAAARTRTPACSTTTSCAALREVCPSQGIMLETTSDRLSARGGPHFGSPDKDPAVRIDAIARAGRLRIPYTSGILIGIGETRRERVEALIALRDLHLEHGHLQEVIVQNFRAKPDTKMADADEPTLDDHLWTIAVARLLLPRDVSVQAPPNLSGDDFPCTARGRHRRLRRRLPCDPRPRESRGAVARRRAPRGGLRRGGPHAAPAPRGVPALPRRPRALARRTARAARRSRPPTASASRAASAGPPAPSRSPRPRGAADAARSPSAASPWRSSARSSGPRTERCSARTMRRPCCRPAVRRSSCSPPPPTADGASARVTASPTSSAGTSTTPTSATSAAASAPSPRASSPRTSAALPTS